MDRCPKDEPTAKNLVCIKSSSHSREKLENLLGLAFTPPPPCPLEGQIPCLRLLTSPRDGQYQLRIQKLIRPLLLSGDHLNFAIPQGITKILLIQQGDH